MPALAQKRAAELAVAKYGIDRALVDRAFRAVLQAQAQGQEQEILDTLVAERLLTQPQADGLRRDMDEPSSDRAAEPAPTSSGHYLRTMGEYRLLRRLGRGGMGSVYLGYEERRRSQVAIKVLSEHLASNEDFVERFYREASSGAHLNHPNIVRCIRVGQDPPTRRHYLVLEFVDGPSAAALLEQMGRLPVGDAVHLTLDIARALEYAHAHNVVHRDIKPDNILLTASGVAKLADLGLAKRTDEASNLTALREGFGTLHYIPCEQAFNAKQADGRSDIYALGATLYHLLTGELPFPGNSPVEIAEKKLAGTFVPASARNPAVPVVLDKIIARMMARDAKDRYQLASELIVDLERSGLVAPLPSFADPELARQKRPTGIAPAVQPTQLDVEGPFSRAAGAAVAPSAWFVRFRNRDGRWCKTKMSTEQIRERLTDGRIPAAAEVARSANGEYVPIASHSDFRVSKPGLPRPKGNAPAVALQATVPTSQPPAKARMWRWAVAAAILGAALMAAGYVLWRPI